MPQRTFAEVAVVLRDTDNVAVLKRSVKAGDELLYGAVHLRVTQNIGAGHKIDIAEIPDGAAVRKYGQFIGSAQGNIAPGEHVHTHNLVMKDFGRDYEFCADARSVAYYAPDQVRTFQGYARPGGRAGTRNYIAVIS